MKNVKKKLKMRDKVRKIGEGVGGKGGEKERG